MWPLGRDGGCASGLLIVHFQSSGTTGTTVCFAATYKIYRILGGSPMKLLNTYQDSEEAAEAAKNLLGSVRVASERDATETIYNVFGIPSWLNFYKLGMYDLPELKLLLETRDKWSEENSKRHESIIKIITVVAKNYSIATPKHWL
jgi:hypothetical protein